MLISSSDGPDIWGLTSVEDYPHVMLSLGVITVTDFDAGVKLLHGRRGRYLIRSLRPAVP